MSKQLTNHSSIEASKSTTLSVILKEQPDRGQALGLIARYLERIAMLWQIPNWSANNSVVLAEWIFDTYIYEPLEVIVECLKNPIVDEEKIYRLTPDVITKWMQIHLENQAVKREREHTKQKEIEKNLLGTAMLPETASDEEKQKEYVDFYKEHFFKFREDYDNIDKKPTHWSEDEKYKAFKAERIRQQLLNSKD